MRRGGMGGGLGALALAALFAAGCDTCARGTAPVAVAADGAAAPEPAPSAHDWPPSGAAKHAAVILVYGAAGPTLFTDATSDHKRYPELLASRGYVVTMPIYEKKGGALAALRAAVGEVAARPDVDPKRIGAIGFSRGAHLALELGAADARVGAIVELYGWLDDGERAGLTRMPPVLILHGEKDRNVRVAEAHALEALFRSKSIDFEMHLYPDEGHGFDPPALEDSAQRAVAFFDARLGHD